MPNLIHRVEEYCKRNNFFKGSPTVIVGLSGGPDSVFLLHALNTLKEQLGIVLIAAHLNHQWRAEAEYEERFCRNLAAEYGVPYTSTTLDALSLNKKPSGSKEELGRIARRTFFETIAQHYENPLIALAHHQDDTRETFFLRLIRGSSLSGLTGIKPQNGRYIRPLLFLFKEEILQFLKNAHTNFCIDASNEDHSYLRNRIRHVALPAFNSCDPRAKKSLIQTIENLSETENFLEKITKSTYQSLLVNNTQDTLDRTKFCALHTALKKRILLIWLIQEKVAFTLSTRFLEELLRFIERPGNGMHTIHRTWCLKKNNQSIQLLKRTELM